MKNFKTYGEFINESKLNEGAVKDLMAMINDGESDEDILKAFPKLSSEDLLGWQDTFINDKIINKIPDSIIGESVNERLSSAQTGALDNMNDWLPEDGLERYLEILNQDGVPAMVKFLKKNADMKVLKKYRIKDDSDLEGLANVLMNESAYTVENNYITNSMINESVIGIKTERDFKPKTLVDALDKAKVKYKINRLSMTLSVLDLDKKYYDDAKKVVDDLGLTVMMAKEMKEVATQVPAKTIAFGSKINEMLDGEKLYKEIEKDWKTTMYSDIEDGSILFYHKDIAKGKAEVNVNGMTGDITIEFRGKGPDGGGEWYGDQVSNMKDIDKQIKKYLKDEKDGKFNESVNEADEEWSDDVKTKWSPPAGTFTKPAKEVAAILKKGSKDLQQAMARLNFYINRAGDNLDAKTKAELEKAKKLLKDLY